jgi:hypothetical protein
MTSVMAGLSSVEASRRLAADGANQLPRTTATLDADALRQTVHTVRRRPQLCRRRGGGRGTSRMFLGCWHG